MYQKMIIVGNLGRDPEMRYMPDGRAVTNISVATSRRWSSSSGEQRSETTWFRVEVWGRQAEAVNQYLSKGRQVLVEGRIKPDPNTGNPRLWTRQDGSVGASFEIVADSVKFIGSREDSSDFTAGDSEEFSGGGSAVQEEDDIPF